jgi:hypothetical protein
VTAALARTFRKLSNGRGGGHPPGSTSRTTRRDAGCSRWAHLGLNQGPLACEAFAGYNALKYAIGPDLAAYVPGTQPPVGSHPTPWKAAVNATELLPWKRGAGAVIPAVQAFRQSGDVNAAIGAARATFRGRGPTGRAVGWLTPKLQAARSTGLTSKNPAARAATRLAFPIPLYAPQTLRRGVPNASLRQLELIGDRGLLFSGAADWAKEQAMLPMRYELALLKKAQQQGTARRYAHLADAAGIAQNQP